MQTLFNDSEVFQKERPTKPTDAQLEKQYSDWAKECIKDGYTTNEEEDIIEDLKKLSIHRSSGFEMAKDLEYDGYEITIPFMEWLESLDYDYDKLVKSNVKAWVAAHNPQPKFEKGTKLIINERLCYKMDKGLIVYVNGGTPEEAVYWINTDPNVYGGTILPYELVESRCQIHP